MLTGLAELFAYWGFLYFLGSDMLTTIWLTLYEQASRAAADYEGRQK